MSLLTGTLLEDYIIGALYGLGSIFLVGAWGIPVASLTSLLWALAGKYGHAIRMWLIPLVVYGTVFALGAHIGAVISYFLTAATFSIGWGIPDVNDQKGSWLGNMFYDMFNKNPFLANLFTRGTIYLLLALSSISSFLVHG